MKSRKKSKIAFAVQQVITFIIVMVGAYFLFKHCVDIMKSQSGGMNFKIYMLIVAAFYFVWYVEYILSAIIHEGGHYIGGKLTGYKLEMFCIMSWMFLNTPEGVKRIKVKRRGIGGQCIMTPPKVSPMPFKLHILGGCLANLMWFVIFGILSYIFKDNLIAFMICYIFAMVNFVDVVINMIPFETPYAMLDGFVFRVGCKNPKLVEYFFKENKVMAKINEGIRMKDMDEELFNIDESFPVEYSLNLRTFSFLKLVDNMNFSEALAMGNKILNADGIKGIVPNQRLFGIKLEMAFCEIMMENRREIVDELLDKDVRKTMKYMGKNPSIMRIRYAYSALVEKNMEEAEKYKEEFNKAISKETLEKDKESETELIHCVMTKIEK